MSKSWSIVEAGVTACHCGSVSLWKVVRFLFLLPLSFTIGGLLSVCIWKLRIMEETLGPVGPLENILKHQVQHWGSSVRERKLLFFTESRVLGQFFCGLGVLLVSLLAVDQTWGLLPDLNTSSHWHCVLGQTVYRNEGYLKVLDTLQSISAACQGLLWAYILQLIADGSCHMWWALLALGGRKCWLALRSASSSRLQELLLHQELLTHLTFTQQRCLTKRPAPASTACLYSSVSMRLSNLASCLFQGLKLLSRFGRSHLLGTNIKS